MASRKLVAAAALSAGLLAGGAAGVILGIPGVSNAQTTTIPGSPGDQGPQSDQPGGHHCNHDGSGNSTPGTNPSATNTAVRFL
jgi:hypothetical protein